MAASVPWPSRVRFRSLRSTLPLPRHLHSRPFATPGIPYRPCVPSDTGSCTDISIPHFTHRLPSAPRAPSCRSRRAFYRPLRGRAECQACAITSTRSAWLTHWPCYRAVVIPSCGRGGRQRWRTLAPLHIPNFFVIGTKTPPLGRTGALPTGKGEKFPF